MKSILSSKFFVILVFIVLLCTVSFVSYNIGKNSNKNNNEENNYNLDFQDNILDNNEQNFIDEDTNIEKKVNEVPINLDNWQDYFEFMTIPEWDYNDFNEVKGLALKLVLHLKDKWQSKVAEGNSHKVAFEVKGTNILKKIRIDYTNKTYQILENDEDTGNDKVITSTYNGSTNDVQIYWCYEGYLIKGVPNIGILENPQVTRVAGSLYLYD